MEEVIDLTFDSGDDSPPKRRTPRRTAAPSPDDHNLLASPLRRMLAVQSGNHQRAAPSQAERPAASKPTRPQLHANPIPTLDDLDLDTGLAARLHASAGHEAAPGPPDPPAARPRRSRQERSRQAAAGIAPPLSVRMPASAYASNGASLPPSQAGEETWGEGPSQWEADAPAAKKTRRPRMTAEEKQAAAERK